MYVSSDYKSHIFTSQLTILQTMLLFYKSECVFPSISGVFCFPFISVALKINVQTPETCFICVIHHNEQQVCIHFCQSYIIVLH